MNTSRSLRQASRMLACSSLTLALFATGCRSEPQETAPPDAVRPEFLELGEAARANAGITVEPARAVTRARRILAPGLIALDETRTARIGSLQQGLVIDTLAQVGDRVRARQLLATMHGSAVHDARAGYRVAIAEQRRAETELAYAVEAHERAGRLYADKAVSLQAVRRAEVDRVAAEQALDMASAEVTRAIEELEHIGIAIEGTPEQVEPNAHEEADEAIPVRSPIDGVVLERLVTPGTTVTPGSPLFVVSDLSSLWAVAEIDESQLSRVSAGGTVEVTVAAYPDEPFAGVITFVADMVNPRTRRITVRSVVPNPDGRLKPEMFATVALGQSEARPTVVIPSAAVQTIDGVSVVFLEQTTNRFVPRTVELGPEQDGLVEIVKGLTAGERVAVDGSFALKSELLNAAGES